MSIGSVTLSGYSSVLPLRAAPVVFGREASIVCATCGGLHGPGVAHRSEIVGFESQTSAGSESPASSDFTSGRTLDITV